MALCAYDILLRVDEQEVGDIILLHLLLDVLHNPVGDIHLHGGVRSHVHIIDLIRLRHEVRRLEQQGIVVRLHPEEEPLRQEGGRRHVREWAREGEAVSLDAHREGVRLCFRLCC